MNARRCQGCAAPLPAGDGADALRCRFCGLVHEATTPSAPTIKIHYDRLPAASLKRPARWLAAIIMLIVIGALVPAIAALYVGWRAASATARSAMPARTAMRTLLAPADLAAAPAGYHDLDAAPPPSGYSAVDAVATLPWALTIAQAWASDARLERIDVARLRPDGTVNAQDDGEALVRYRFISPGRVAALREQARLTTKAEGDVGLFVVMQKGKVQGYVESASGASTRGEPPAPHPAVAPLAKLVAMPQVEGMIDGAPFLNGYLIHLADEGWVWYFSTLANESKPRVRARDGAVWPYRRTR